MVCTPSLSKKKNLNFNILTVFHFWGFTLQSMEIENALYTLPYISAAVVLPVDDEEYKERAAAILKLKPGFIQPDFNTLRQDLTDRTGLFLFKQPTVLYWLKEGEEIPVSLNGKISKRDAKQMFFGDAWKEKLDVLVLALEKMDYWRIGGLV
jgi:malonyl-CoA/methylmalonyl-CoA synthetase